MRHEFQAKMPEVSEKIKFYIGDVRDVASVKNAMHGVDYIFHAAALKQVPSCEFFPIEAVKTNVLGTENVLTAAIDAGVKNVVCLSTDKAAYPVNAMGTSKAMMEKVIVAKSRTVSPDKTKICCTRYGNVMCSRGSTIKNNYVVHRFLIFWCGEKRLDGMQRKTKISEVYVHIRRCNKRCIERGDDSYVGSCRSSTGFPYYSDICKHYTSLLYQGSAPQRKAYARSYYN